jgi:hypothetical protein
MLFIFIHTTQRQCEFVQEHEGHLRDFHPAAQANIAGGESFRRLSLQVGGRGGLRQRRFFGECYGPSHRGLSSSSPCRASGVLSPRNYFPQTIREVCMCVCVTADAWLCSLLVHVDRSLINIASMLLCFVVDACDVVVQGTCL